METAGTGTKSGNGVSPLRPAAVSGRAAKARTATTNGAGVAQASADASAKRRRVATNETTTTGGTIQSARVSKEELRAFDAMVAELGYRRAAVDSADREDIVMQYRSLLHVAATRAKKALRVSWSGKPTSLVRT